MKAIMLMFDTLNRHMLSAYGCDWTHTPNFRRLAERTAVFDQAYVGSMPCMPARRELHTGRHNFLHRSWGPLEPFDDSMPELLKRHGVYTHMVTDHQHYWEDGGGTYHTRFNTCELIRGQEGDPWKGQVKDPATPESVGTRDLVGPYRQDWINRQYVSSEQDFPQAKTFQSGIEFIRHNHTEDRWFLQLETFDPHEPFHAPEKYRQLYAHTYEGKHFDWPMYKRVSETQEEIDHVRLEYAALLSMCDDYLGKVLDVMDELDLWKDTMLIVNTDHGFLLGEHDWWAKCAMPFYNEIAHMPLFIWDPRTQARGVRRSSLVQNVDLAPTLLRYFGVDIPKDMTGHCLQQTIADDTPVREAAIFGIHGGHVNCTDGRYVYMRGPAASDNQPLYNYTLMPTHMRSRFAVSELKPAKLHEPFAFTKEVPVLQIPSTGRRQIIELDTLLFDLQNDPQQLSPITDPEVEQRMVNLLVDRMKREEAPAEQFVRLGLA
ncbi:sulfatase [Paenibacillus sp. PL2-23]|uniref:sulfatase n=1 Tax=Paenibacillus sp. PL2-23 TaxID=2100729 RepID=UPI0030F5F6B1